MNLIHPEYFERERRNDLLREAEAERLAGLARRTAVRPSATRGRPTPRGFGRLLLLLRRAAT